MQDQLRPEEAVFPQYQAMRALWSEEAEGGERVGGLEGLIRAVWI